MFEHFNWLVEYKYVLAKAATIMEERKEYQIINPFTLLEVQLKTSWRQITEKSMSEAWTSQQVS